MILNNLHKYFKYADKFINMPYLKLLIIFKLT